MQVALAKFMPTEVFIAVTCILLVAVAMSLARLAGSFTISHSPTAATPRQTQQDKDVGQQQQPVRNRAEAAASAATGNGKQNGQAATGPPFLDLWRTWQLVSGVAGLAIVPQVLYNVTVPGSTTLVPGLTALAIISGYYFLKVCEPGAVGDLHRRARCQ